MDNRSGENIGDSVIIGNCAASKSLDYTVIGNPFIICYGIVIYYTAGI